MGIFTIAMLLWLTGRIASDRWTWSQWLAWIPSVAPIAIATLLLVLAWARRRGISRTRRRVVRIAFLLVWAAVAIWFAEGEHRFLHRDPSDPSGLRIAHWTDNHPHPMEFERVVETMRAQHADITILSHAGSIAISRPVRAWLDGQRGAQTNGFGVFTTLPIRRMERILREDDIVIAFVQVDATEKVGRPINIYLIDLPSHTDRSRAEVAEQVRTALADVATGIPPADLVIGDANIPRGSWSLGRMFPSFEHAFDQAGHGYGATFHRSFPLLHIDQFLLSPDWQATDYDIVDPGYGRHRLQAATIKPRNASAQ